MRVTARRRLVWVTLFTAAVLLCALGHRIRPLLAIEAADDHQRCAALFVLNTTRDLGPVADRKQWQIAFSVQNTGTRRLVLNELDLACGCGERSLRTIVVPPQAAVDLLVNLDTRFVSGPIEKLASFTTNDPARPRLDLRVNAIVDAAGLPAEPDGDQ